MTAGDELARRRRIRALIGELGDELARGSPELAERTRDMLAGDLPLAADPTTPEDPMGQNDAAIQLRLPSEVLERADELMGPMSRVPLLAAVRLSRSAVLRMALMRGLDALEAEHGGKRGRK